jgi:glutamine amidotransferase
MIVVIDYKMGNIGSIINMIKKAGGEAKFSPEIDQIEKAEKLILPGVGAFDAGMQNLTKLGLVDVLRKKVFEDKVPILGVCLGMQLFMERSEEGVLPGLGFIKGSVVRFRFDENNSHLRIPHMGWDSVEVKKESPLFSSMYEEPVFYFVHSYHVVCDDAEDVLSTTNYGYKFASSLQRGNIFGTQFHPEKSHKYGLKLIQNFIKLAS